ncbi:hypothetical protein K438DRAFT_1842434 [Mycena galopus ATCC 62051]|nr:hypothetical protein K438DRAFT_1842434 [Mycena galopus ATCC 62051]
MRKTEIVCHLLKHGAKVNAKHGGYGSALCLAAHACYMEIVQILLQNGANVNAIGGEYGTALPAAS